MVKRWLPRVILGFVILSSLFLLGCVLRVKSQHGIRQMMAFYEQPADSIDVLFIGSSHVHVDINTGRLFEQYGIAGYDLSAAEQPLWATRYYIEEALKYQTPKLIVLDLYTPIRYDGRPETRYEWIQESILGMRNSYPKWKLLRACIDDDRFFEYFPDFFLWHNRYTDLTEEDLHWFPWNAKEHRSFKGFTPYLHTEVWPNPPEKPEDRIPLTEDTENAIREIIRYCGEQEIPLLLICAPYWYDSNDLRRLNSFEDIAAETGTPFIDYNERCEEMGLSFETDFYDFSHLAFPGTVKYADVLGRDLKTFADLPDRRGDERYRSWEENAEGITEYAARGEDLYS